MGKKFILIFLFFMFLVSSVSGATYYVDDNAVDNTGNGLTPGTAKHNIQSALSLCNSNGGDTVIILDGVYDESADQITQAYLPSNSNSYTTIKAQNRWGVEIRQRLDANEDRTGRNYVHLDGLKFTSLSAHSFNGENWKITNCAFYGSLGMGNSFQESYGVHCKNILVEDTHVWGPGGVNTRRYKVSTQSCTNVIWRRVVARHDGGYTSPGYENPSALFMVYSSEHVRLQNCIAIDSPGQSNDYWSAGYYTADHQSNYELYWQDVKWQGSIAMNIDGAPSFRIDNTHNSNGYDTVYDNCVAIAGTGGDAFVAYISSSTSDNVIYNQCTAIDCGEDSNDEGMVDYGYDSTVRSSIVLNQVGAAMGSIDTTSYNNAYGCGNNNPGTNGFTTNPENNGLLYPVRIESGSSLKIAGGGTQVGADITKKWGESGTLWGESGYDTLTNEDLWPFPNEEEIKEDFIALGGGSDSTRGFTDSTSTIYGGTLTLTSYIWEYLGNECPLEICEGTPSVPQTCTDAGGTCQTNSCGDYQDCISLSGTCSSGNCCLGTCTEIVILNCTDSDGDGFNVSQTGCGISDCNDLNLSINPEATEICGNGVDEDCSGSDLECPVNETEEEEEIPVVVDEGSSGGSSGGGSSSIPECVFTNAFWSVVSAIEGQQVSLTVEGTDCDGEEIDLFVIWEDDLIGDDSVNQNPSTVGFSDGKAVSSWTVEYQDDFFGNPEYYFVSTLSSDSSVVIDSRDYGDLLRVSEAGSSSAATGCPNYVWTGIR